MYSLTVGSDREHLLNISGRAQGFEHQYLAYRWTLVFPFLLVSCFCFLLHSAFLQHNVVWGGVPNLCLVWKGAKESHGVFLIGNMFSVASATPGQLGP